MEDLLVSILSFWTSPPVLSVQVAPKSCPLVRKLLQEPVKPELFPFVSKFLSFWREEDIPKHNDTVVIANAVVDVYGRFSLTATIVDTSSRKEWDVEIGNCAAKFVSLRKRTKEGKDGPGDITAVTFLNVGDRFRNRSCWDQSDEGEESQGGGGELHICGLGLSS